ncbi:MAG: hypothetical protein CFE39_11965 [Comamonadaceae bacterium PBBC2]|nr:MAG: hypothetical protein CFE39_11965 [Comamonadaceae bacterium PBBC2]
MLIQFTPFVTRQRFAELVGVTDDTLERWIRDGRVPCFQMGKRSLVDMRVWIAGGLDLRGLAGASGERKAQSIPPLSNTGINGGAA